MQLYLSLPDINSDNQSWWQNVSSLKKILIMVLFQIAETELREIILKKWYVGPCFGIYIWIACSTSMFYDIFRYTENILCFYPKNRHLEGVLL